MKKVLLILASFLFYHNLLAIDTQLIVRAKAKDAKFIGSSIGGAFVVIKNQLTGEILAQGKTVGSTGNTNLIMKEARERGKPIADDKTAKFLATVDISEPTFIQIEVTSPINKKQAAITASTQLWLIPNKHLLGDGIVVEIPGFIIDILKPRTHQFISLSSLTNNQLAIEANMVMMCGCTISNDGLWNAKNMEVKAIINKNGMFYKEVTLTAIESNLFTGQLLIDEGGTYEVIVYGYDQKTGNTGVDKVNFVVD